MSTSLLWLDPLVVSLVKGDKVLDLGCGFGHWGHLLTTHCHEMKDRQAVTAPTITGVDAFHGNIEFCRGHNIYESVHESDAVAFLKDLETGSYDTVLAIDLIEHMDKAIGEELLSEMERVATQVIILSTPNFKNLRDGAEGITGFNQWEQHVSWWPRQEFKQRGFQVRGVRHNLYSRIYRLKGMHWFLRTWPVIDDLLHALAFRCSRIAHTVLVYKALKPPDPR